MATNYLQKGDVLTLTAPADVSSGGVVNVGDFVGVAQSDALTGAEVEVGVVGVYELPVASALEVAVGDLLYWDAADGELNNDNANPLAGAATQVSGAGDTSVGVRLKG